MERDRRNRGENCLAVSISSDDRSTPSTAQPRHEFASSGVEAVYVVEGEACYETATRAAKLKKGYTLALPGDTPMRAVVTGTRVAMSWPSPFTTRPIPLRRTTGTAR